MKPERGAASRGMWQEILGSGHSNLKGRKKAMDNVRKRLKIEKEEDRTTMVGILAKNGYALRIIREKPDKKNKFNHFIEYWQE